ncbi:hypothetical protein Dimus_038110 [Dionaea muscipula]
MLIRQCISTTTLSILLNGTPVGRIFILEQGLRQGDPLSLTLFILCMEALSRLLAKAAEEGRFAGFSIGRGCLRITHLLFADDVLLFAKVTRQNLLIVKEIIKTFKRCTRLQMNLSKSMIQFSRNTPENHQKIMCQLVGMRRLTQGEYHLGLPLFNTRARIRDDNFIIERVQGKLEGWKGRLLSFAGRLTLIQSVAGAIPLYPMAPPRP